MRSGVHTIDRLPWHAPATETPPAIPEGGVLLLLFLKLARNKMLYLVAWIHSVKFTLLFKALRHHSRRSHVLIIGRIHLCGKNRVLRKYS